MTRLILALVAAAALSACEKAPNAQIVRSSGSGGDVVLVTLADGTRCAVLVGAYKGGIDCDWGVR